MSAPTTCPEWCTDPHLGDQTFFHTHHVHFGEVMISTMRIDLLGRTGVADVTLVGARAEQLSLNAEQARALAAILRVLNPSPETAAAATALSEAADAIGGAA